MLSVRNKKLMSDAQNEKTMECHGYLMMDAVNELVRLSLRGTVWVPTPDVVLDMCMFGNQMK